MGYHECRSTEFCGKLCRTTFGGGLEEIFATANVVLQSSVENSVELCRKTFGGDFEEIFATTNVALQSSVENSVELCRTM